MEKKGVRSQGKTRIGEEECRCKTMRMWGKKKGKQKRRTDAEGRGACIHTHTHKKKEEKRAGAEERRMKICRRTAVEKCQCKSKSETRMNNRRED